MQHIGIDCRFASLDAGIGRFTREIVAALLRRSDAFSYVLFPRSAGEEWLRGLPGSARIIPFDAAHYSLAEQLRFPSLLQRAHVDLLFSPQFNVPYACPVPYVCTVHDLILHTYPNHASLFKRLAYRVLFRRAVSRARHIVTVSDATRRDLVEAYGVAVGTRSSTVYPGIASDVFSPQHTEECERVRRLYGLPDRFLLYIGNAKQHKNVPLLLDAFSRMSTPGASLVLVCAGEEAERLRLPAGACRLSHVPDADLPALYTAATGYVSASAYEGFGLPLLEAMACGCPVAAVAGGSVPEVCGGHARLCDASPASLAAAMDMLFLSPPLPSARDAAMTHARSFSWDRTAQEVALLFSAHVSSVH